MVKVGGYYSGVPALLSDSRGRVYGFEVKAHAHTLRP